MASANPRPEARNWLALAPSLKGGYFSNGTADQTLIEHWNGKAWKVQKSPNPGGAGNSNDLYGVAATSGTNAWGVGEYFNGTVFQTPIEHWNGKSGKGGRGGKPGDSGGAPPRVRRPLR